MDEGESLLSLETMAAEAGAEDLWEGLERHQEFAVAEALKPFSRETADEVIAEVRRDDWGKA